MMDLPDFVIFGKQPNENIINKLKLFGIQKYQSYLIQEDSKNINAGISITGNVTSIKFIHSYIMDSTQNDPTKLNIVTMLISAQNNLIVRDIYFKDEHACSIFNCSILLEITTKMGNQVVPEKQSVISSPAL